MVVRGIEVLFGLERNWFGVKCENEIIGVEIIDLFGWYMGKNLGNGKLGEYF